MLTHRTNLLLSAQEYQLYSRIAQSKNLTLSGLIRVALAKTFQKTQQETISSKIRAGWKFLKKPSLPLDYVEIAQNGRKYE